MLCVQAGKGCQQNSRCFWSILSDGNDPGLQELKLFMLLQAVIQHAMSISAV